MNGILLLGLALGFFLNLSTHNNFFLSFLLLLFLGVTQYELSRLKSRLDRIDHKKAFSRLQGRAEKQPTSGDDENLEIEEEEGLAPVPAVFSNDDEEDIHEQEEIPVSVAKEVSRPPVKVKKREPFDWESFFFRKLLPVFGVLSLVLGIGFFLGWAIKNNYLNEFARIGLGVVFCLGLIVGGEFLRKKYPDFYPLITGSGIAGLLLTTYLARALYGMVSMEGSFILYLLEMLFGVFLALRYDSKGLAFLSFLGALVAPLLSHMESPLGMLVYILVLALGAFFISLYKRWGSLMGVMFVGAFFYEFLLFLRGGILETPEVFVGLIFTIHALIGSGGVVRALCDNQKVAYPLKFSQGRELFEVILFCGSLLTANILNFIVFESQSWPYFGYLLLIQSLLLGVLALWFSKEGLSLYEKILWIAASGFMLLGTFIEVAGVESWFLLSLLFIFEGSLLSYAGKVRKELIFSVFGRIGIWLAFFFIWNISSLWQSSVAIISLMIGYLVSTSKADTPQANFWLGLALGGMTLHLVDFLLFKWVEVLPEGMKWLAVLLILLWGIGLCLVSRKLLRSIFHVFGIFIFALVSFAVFPLIGISLSDGLGALFLSATLVLFITWYCRDRTLLKTESLQQILLALFWSISLFLTFFFGDEYILNFSKILVLMLLWASGVYYWGIHNRWNELSGVLGMSTLLGIGVLGAFNLDAPSSWSILLTLLYFMFLGWMFWESRPKKNFQSSYDHLVFTHGGLFMLSLWMFNILQNWISVEPLAVILWSVYGMILALMGILVLKRNEFQFWGWIISVISIFWYLYWVFGLANPPLLPAVSGCLFVGSILGWIGLSFRSVVALKISWYPIIVSLSVAIMSVLLLGFGSEILSELWVIALMVLWGIGIGSLAFVWKEEMYRFWGWGIQVFSSLLFWIYLWDQSPIISFSIAGLLMTHLGIIFSGRSFFWAEKPALPLVQRITVLTSLVVSSFSSFVFGLESLQEPYRTVFWMVYGIIFLLIGLKKEWHYFLRMGMIILSLVIAKLYIHDLWEWEIWMRFIAFFILGIGILFLSFYFQKTGNSRLKK